MSVTVPASDINGTALQTAVTAAQASYNAGVTAGSPFIYQLAQALDTAQQALVMYLMANNKARTPLQFGVGPSFLSASGLLSAGTINQ